ncbi:hypothetical protein KIN20_019576 [Parelaphostrongylus tenuis]|uniref:Uncharacterized protein n=1 Tax=Parelaphostrongylus tenuis TaxID=148309 RepID=A0AAD5QSZ9_PARTN|nr:hypothetical protein KIN20_019576 [Parelaphostrongylus tenuis]
MKKVAVFQKIRNPQWTSVVSKLSAPQLSMFCHHESESAILKDTALLSMLSRCTSHEFVNVAANSSDKLISASRSVSREDTWSAPRWDGGIDRELSSDAVINRLMGRYRCQQHRRRMRLAH